MIYSEIIDEIDKEPKYVAQCIMPSNADHRDFGRVGNIYKIININVGGSIPMMIIEVDGMQRTVYKNRFTIIEAYS